MEEKILITGATGRIGNYLVDALVNEKEKVRALVNNGKVKNENVEIFYGNILDKNTVKKALDGVDIVYHLAAVVDYLAPKDIVWEVNVEGTRNLVEIARGKKIIYLSSTAVMGRNLNAANEETPCHPSNFYGKTKLEAEKIVKNAEGVIIRSPDVMFPGFTEGYDYVFSKLEEGKMPLIGDGTNLIHNIHINDLIEGLLLAKENGKPGEVYIVAGKEVKTLKDTLAMACTFLNVEPPTKSTPKFLAKAVAQYKVFKSKITKERPNLIPEYIDKITANRSFDISKAKRELDFEPKIGYEIAIKEMVEDYLKRKVK